LPGPPEIFDGNVFFWFSCSSYLTEAFYMSPLSDEQFQEIFARYLADKASPEELDLLFERLGSGKTVSALDGLLEAAFVDPSMAEQAGSEDKMEVLAALHARMGEEQQGVQIREEMAHGGNKARLRLLRPWLTAAASLILLVGTGYWYFNRIRTAVPATVLSTPVKGLDAHPGITGAILTLADGSTINLDSTSTADLPARQGDTRLSRKDNELQYAAEEGGTKAVVYNTVTTPRGRKYSIRLSDGTRVWLNAGSSMRFPVDFGPGSRDVAVTGEVYLEVSPDKERPFVVESGSVKITVLGTRFDVMNYSDEKKASVMLLQGSVRVGTGSKNLVLEPGNEAQVDHSTGAMTTRPEDSTRVIAWTRDLLDLNNADFGALMRQISRWYDVDVEFKGMPAGIHIGGLLHRNVDLQVLLQYLADNGVHYSVEGKTITILP
jgi:ferric-dicitrate binding protein FerR (iron transport regulator)